MVRACASTANEPPHRDGKGFAHPVRLGRTPALHATCQTCDMGTVTVELKFTGYEPSSGTAIAAA